jgi:hypothetical protein
MPGIIPEVGRLIHQHWVWIRDGMPIREGWRRWVEAGGPCDPRSKLGYMSYSAYRRMLSNPRYTGRFAFGRTRSVWLSKRDYATQVAQPETEVVMFYSEELRIVEDELFFAVQQRLAELKLGPRGPKKHRQHQLWDLVTDLFHCAACDVRFYLSGANGGSMSCKRGKLCPCMSNVNRKQAVRAICDKLRELLVRDTELIQKTILLSQQVDSQGDDRLRTEAAAMENEITTLTNKIHDLYDVAGQGSEADRHDVKVRILRAQVQRAESEANLTRVRKALGDGTAIITPEQVREILTKLPELLEAGADGFLGSDMVYRAASVLRQLVGGQIMVHVERRPGRKQTNVRAIFFPRVLETVQGELAIPVSDDQEVTAVEVWLRKPPQHDLLADRAHELVDVDGRSYEEAAMILQAEGHASVKSATVWQLRRRYYQIVGQPAPKLPYNNGNRRRSA